MPPFAAAVTSSRVRAKVMAMEHPARKALDRRLALLAAVVPLAGPVFLRLLRINITRPEGMAVGAVVLIACGGLAAWAAAPAVASRRHPFAAAAVFLLAALSAGAVLRPLWSAPVPTLHAMAHFLLAALGPLSLAVVLVAAGGLVAGRLASGHAMLSRPDVLHWLGGAVLAGLVGLPLGTAGGLAGHWVAQSTAAWLMAGACAFWTLWARAEPLPAAAPPVAAPARPEGRLPRAIRPSRRGRALSPAAWSAARAVLSGAWSAIRAVLSAAWSAARTCPSGRPLPVSVSLADARTRMSRLLGLYCWSAVGAAPLLLLLLLGSRAGWLWLDPARLPARWPALALCLAGLALALPTVLALRRGLLHPREYLWPLPRPLPWLAYSAGAVLLTRLGTAHLGGRGLAAPLHLAPLPLAVALGVMAILLTAFLQGLVQTRLQDVFPPWVAVLAPAVVLALSGPVMGLPLPPPAWTLLLGLWLGLSRRVQGTAGTAAALAAAWAGLALVGH